MTVQKGKGTHSITSVRFQTTPVLSLKGADKQSGALFPGLRPSRRHMPCFFFKISVSDIAPGPAPHTTIHKFKQNNQNLVRHVPKSETEDKYLCPVVGHKSLTPAPCTREAT